MARDRRLTRMLNARVGLLLDQPFYGQIIMHLDIQDATDWCQTAATDGRKFYYNRDFIDALSDAELTFLCGHEVLHAVYDHISRRGERNKPLWNMAADALINFILTRDEVGKMPKGGIYDKHLTDEFSVEEIYDLLDKRAVKVQQPIDMHLDLGDGDGDGSNESEADADSGSPAQAGPPKLTKEEQDEIRETMRTLVVQAAQNAPGQVPAGVQRMINRLVAPKINWRQHLTRVVRSTIKHDYSYARPSRRSWGGVILPGQVVGDRIKAWLWLDGSQSTTQEMITDFLSECQGIIRSFRDFELTIGTFDTETYNVVQFTPANASTISHYKFKGGGGTAPSCCWDYMKQQYQKPDLIVVFTDGEVGTDWGDPSYAETIFVIHSNPHIEAAYGQTIHYER